MGMPFFDNVNYSGKKPLDSRAGYDTVANMVAATKVYDGLMAYVTATKKYYTYDSANEADPTLGKWREFEGGGSGASNLSDLGDVLIDDETLEGGQHLEYNEDSGRWVNGVPTLDKQTDVNITNPSNGDVLQYNSTSGKWENKSGENVIVNGYAYTPPLQTVQDYIDAANAHFGKTLSFANPSILDGKTVGSIILAYAPTKAYIIFSEGKISLTPYNLKRSGHYYMESSRWATDGSNISGYNITPTAYGTPVSALNSITIKGTSEIDINAYDMPDENHEGWFYYSENATLSSGYFGQTKELVETLYFYSDQAHTEKITPESGKFYVDIPSGDMYEWRNNEYKKVGGSGSGGSYTAGDGIAIENDEISIDPMPAEDMNEVVDTIPSGGRVAVTGYVPLGTLISYYGETAPRFFLACDGATYNKADYPELAEHLLSLTNHSQYEVNGDDTKFKVPDMRGEFLRGTGTNSHTSEGSGAAVGVHQNGTSIPNIAPWSSTTSNYVIQGFTDANGNSYGIENYDGSVRGVTAHRSVFNTSSRDTNGSGQGLSLKIRPTNTSVLFCIAYKDIYSNPMNDYSTDEKVVGTWIDGSTLYQKTLQITMPTANESIIATGIASGNHARIIDGFIEQTGSSGNNYTFPLLFLNGSPLTMNVLVQVTVDASKLYVWSNFDKTDGKTAYVTIQYTKTT